MKNPTSKTSSTSKRSTFHGDRNRPVFPNGSYLYGRLASPKVRALIPSQQEFRKP